MVKRYNKPRQRLYVDERVLEGLRERWAELGNHQNKNIELCLRSDTLHHEDTAMFLVCNNCGAYGPWLVDGTQLEDIDPEDFVRFNAPYSKAAYERLCELFKASVKVWVEEGEIRVEVQRQSIREVEIDDLLMDLMEVELYPGEIFKCMRCGIQGTMASDDDLRIDPEWYFCRWGNRVTLGDGYWDRIDDDKDKVTATDVMEVCVRCEEHESWDYTDPTERPDVAAGHEECPIWQDLYLYQITAADIVDYKQGKEWKGGL